MIRRIALVGMLLGLAAGCYDVPRPACGFFCGTTGACPDDYTCNQADNRCHLNGSPAQTCATHDAGPVDVPADMLVIDGNIAPTVSQLTPTPSSTNVPVNAQISAVFSEDVTGINGSTFLLLQGTTQIPGTVFYSSAADEATFTPDSQLQPQTEYIVELTSGIADLQGAPLMATAWPFTTGADTIAPSITMRVPGPNTLNIPVRTTISVTFNEPMMGIDATTFTVAAGATAISGTVTYAPATRTATFTPAMSLPAGTLISVTLGTGVTDQAGNTLQPAPFTYTFTTAADTTAPAVTARAPMMGDTNVPITSAVTATFSEPVTGVSATTFTLAAGATPIAGTVTYDAGTKTATFTPTSPLPSSTQLTATLTAGVTDTAGNPLASAPVTWMFTTAADTTAPAVQSQVPASGATMVPTTTTVAVTFSEPVTGVTTSSFTVDAGAGPVAGTLASSNGGATWTFTPTAPLAAAATVTVSLTTAITDLAANPLAATSYMFATQ